MPIRVHVGIIISMEPTPAERWPIDPRSPVAPPTEVWDRLTPGRRRALAEALTYAPNDELDAMAPEGTRHDDEVTETTDRLRQWFGGVTRQAFVAKNLRVFYPNEAPFDPDVLVVLDVPRAHRDSWVTVQEGGRGLDVVIEVIWRGDRNKDLVQNVSRYARLGIPEYYVVDLKRGAFYAYHLTAKGGPYLRVETPSGRIHSTVLGLELVFDGRSLRLMHGISPVLSSREAHGQLQVVLSELSSELAEEKAHSEALERRIAELLAERDRSDT